MDNMNSNFEKLMNVVATLVKNEEASADNNTPTAAFSDAVDLKSVHMNIADEFIDQDPLNSKTSRENMTGTELSEHFESPEHKRLRSSQKRLFARVYLPSP